MEPTVSAILAAGAVGGFAVTAITCWLLIPALHRLHFGQTIREEGPTWHNKKNGTPTMGGLGFIFGILLTIGVVYGLFHSSAPEVLGPQQMAAGMLVLFLAFGNGLIGFLDDFIKVIKHRNLGLTAWQKIVLQVAVTVGFMIGLHSLGLLSTSVMFPVAGMVDLGLAYYPIAFFGIIFLVNAVNLTDGLDGLCTGVTFVSMLGYLLAGSLLGFVHVSLLAATTAGATRLQRIIHINLPAIMPTIVIMLIMAVGGIMNLSFEKVLLMQTDSNTAVSEVISTYVYKLGIQRAQYSLSAAVGLFNNIINLILLVTVNKVSRKISETSLW